MGLRATCPLARCQTYEERQSRVRAAALGVVTRRGAAAAPNGQKQTVEILDRMSGGM